MGPHAARTGSPLPSSQQLRDAARRGAGSDCHGHTDAVTGLRRPGAPRPPLPARADLQDRGRVVTRSPGQPPVRPQETGSLCIFLRRYSEVSQGEQAAGALRRRGTPKLKAAHLTLAERLRLPLALPSAQARRPLRPALPRGSAQLLAHPGRRAPDAARPRDTCGVPTRPATWPRAPPSSPASAPPAARGGDTGTAPHHVQRGAGHRAGPRDPR